MIQGHGSDETDDMLDSVITSPVGCFRKGFLFGVMSRF